MQAFLCFFPPSTKQRNRGKNEFTNILTHSCQGTSEKPKLGSLGFGVGTPQCLEFKPKHVILGHECAFSEVAATLVSLPEDLSPRLSGEGA